MELIVDLGQEERSCEILGICAVHIATPNSWRVIHLRLAIVGRRDITLAMGLLYLDELRS